MAPPIAPFDEYGKPCGRCARWKPYSAYTTSTRTKSGFQSHCKSCTSYKERQRRGTRNPDLPVKKLMGLSITEYNKMAAESKGLCAICGGPEVVTRQGEVRRLAIDHSHETGKVRGLLCQACNTTLGYMKDDRNRLLSAVAYLDKHHPIAA